MKISQDSFYLKEMILGNKIWQVDLDLLENPSFDKIIKDICDSMLSRVGNISFLVEVCDSGKRIILKSGVSKDIEGTIATSRAIFAEISLDENNGILTRIDYAYQSNNNDRYSKLLEYSYSWYDSDGIELEHSLYIIDDMAPKGFIQIDEKYLKNELDKRNPHLMRGTIVTSRDLPRDCTKSHFVHACCVNGALGTVSCYNANSYTYESHDTYSHYDVLPYGNPEICHRIGQYGERVEDNGVVDEEELIRNELAYYKELVRLASAKPSKEYDILLRRVKNNLKIMGVNPDEYDGGFTRK